MSARRCPKCKTVYSDTARFCPKDGTMLVEVQAPPAAPPPPPAPPGSGSGTKVRTPPVAAKGITLDRASTLSNQVLDTRYQVLPKLGRAAAPRGWPRDAARPPQRVPHPAAGGVRGRADLPGDAVPQRRAALR